MPDRRIGPLVAVVSLSLACGGSPPREDEIDFTTNGTSSSGPGSTSGAPQTTTSSGADSSSTSSAESSSGSESSTGELVGCGNGLVEPGEICLDPNDVVYAMGTGVRDLYIADFNLDGVLDLATLDVATPMVYLRHGDGDAGFDEPLSWVATPGAFGMDAGDFDLDGDTDIVVFGADLTMLENKAGTLEARDVNSAGVVTDQLNDGVVGSFDMLLGLDVVHTTQASVYHQRGSIVGNEWVFGQQFQLPVMTEGASGVARAAFAFDGDDLDDVVILNRDLDFAQLLVANGGGGFQFVTNIDVCPAGAGAYRVEIGELNGDGIEDLVVTCDVGVWSVVLGLPDGEFEPPTLQILDTAYRPGIGDIDQDGDADVAITQSALGRVEIYVNDGTGLMTYDRTLDAAGDAWSFEIADLNGDGAVDVATAVTSSDGVGSVAIFWAVP